MELSFLQVLVVADDPADATQVHDELQRAGVAADVAWVATEADYVAAVQRNPDIILCAWRLSAFTTSIRAQDLRNEAQRDTLLFLLLDSIRDEATVNLTSLGASDYLIKDRLGRLVPAIKQGLAHRALRIANRQMQTVLQGVEAALQLRNRAIQAVTQSIVITDAQRPDNPIIYCSPAFERLTGYTVHETVGHNCRFLQGNDTDKAVVARIRESIRAAQPSRETLLNYRKDGTPFWNDLSLSPLFDTQGQLTHFVAVQTDVTERRSLEEQLQQAQKMDAIGRLAGGVAHDFNNLLTIINMESEMLLDDFPEKSPHRESLSAIHQAGTRAAELTAHLLAFGRKTIVDPQILNLNQAVALSAQLLRRVIGRNIELVTVCTPKDLSVKIDPAQLEQVFMNLAVNARDAMPNGGVLTITTAHVTREYDESVPASGSYAQLMISDNGEGMPEAVREKIFEPFFTTKGIGKGTGLGLATVYGNVHQAGGTIAVQSEVGKGTRVEILLPEFPSSPSVAPHSKVTIAPKGTETILLAEDEEGVRRAISATLRLQGYKVIEARGGPEAQQEFATYGDTIDLLITDLVMPGMGGRELAAVVCNHRPAIRVLYISGYTDDPIVRHRIEDAQEAFLQKPFTPFSLARKVREVLDAHRG